MRLSTLVLVLVACRSHARVDARGESAIAIVAKDPGSDVEAIEQQVAVPIEHAIVGMPHIAHVRTSILPGTARIEVELDDGVDPFAASTELMERIPHAQLPERVVAPTVMREPRRSALLRYVLRGPLPATQLRTFADWNVSLAMLKTRGVAQVETCGGALARWVIEPDPGRLAALAMSPTDVVAAVRAGNTALPAGTGSGAIVVRSVGPHDLDSLSSIVIAQRNGVPVRIRDVASVRQGGSPPDCRAFDEQGGVVVGAVRVRQDADVGEVRAAVDQALATVRAALPPGVTLEVFPSTISFVVTIGTPDEVVAIRDQVGKQPGVAHVLVEQDAHDGSARVYLALADDASARDVETATIAALRGRGLVVHDRDEVIVQILGPDPLELSTLARSVAASLAAIHGLTANGEVGGSGRSWLEVIPDRMVLARVDVDAREVADLIATNSEGGLEVGEMWQGDRREPIAISIPGREQLLELRVRNHEGVTIPLSELARIEQRTGLAELHRQDGERWLGVAAIGDPDAVREAAGRIAMPAGYHWRLAASTVEP
jgi:Cu/Ag efflux pump CusA